MPGSAEDAREALKDRLRELAANIMRVTRSSGRALEIGMQAQSLLNATAEYRSAVGHYPSVDELKKALRIDDPASMESAPAPRHAVLYARRTIVRGEVQVAASRLLQQEAEESAGEA